jgi:hypothetical protein
VSIVSYADSSKLLERGAALLLVDVEYLEILKYIFGHTATLFKQVCSTLESRVP